MVYFMGSDVSRLIPFHHIHKLNIHIHKLNILSDPSPFGLLPGILPKNREV